jgi:hypothetical protein
MSNEFTKQKRSTRIHDEETKIKKQVKIAKAHGLTDKDKAVKEPHRMSKHHAMDCGQPGCILCGNPRKLFKEKTIQEKSFYQEKLYDESKSNLPE